MTTKKKLPFRIDSLDRVPANLHELYEADPKGGFVLQVDGAAPPPEAPPPVADDKPKSRAEQIRAELVAKVLQRIQPKDSARKQVAESIAKLIEVHEVEGATQVRFMHPSGWPWPSSLPGKNFIGDDVDEFALRAITHAEVVKPEQLPAAAPPAPTREQADLADSEPLTTQPRNIRFKSGGSQKDFERAFEEANRRGGRVIIEDVVEDAEPTRTFRPGKDVPLPSGSSQAEFERAMHLARQNGGEVVIAPAPPPAELTESDMKLGEGLAAMHAQKSGAYR